MGSSRIERGYISPTGRFASKPDLSGYVHFGWKADVSDGRIRRDRRSSTRRIDLAENGGAQLTDGTQPLPLPSRSSGG